MIMEPVVKTFQRLQPINFLGADNIGGQQCLQALKQLYDLVKRQEEKVGLDFGQQQQKLKQKLRKKKHRLSIVEAPLPQLVTQNFDSEQIWQELQLQNNFLYDELVSSVSSLAAINRRLGNEDSDKADEPMSEDESDPELASGAGPAEASKPGSLLLEASQENATDSSDSEDDRKLSNFEHKTKQAEKLIKQVEEEALQPKPWQLTGETTAATRPENALLEEHLMFDHLIRQAPLITAETTLKLEDIIKQRVKDQVWDDVERKARPVEGRVEYKKTVPLNAEKSKESLAEIYEKETLAKLKPNEEPSVPEYQVEIQKELDDLFMKLDALSNFHYTPVNPTAEIRVVTNLPSIAMEEATPVTMTDATMLAPAELEPEQRRALKSVEEYSETDKKRKRRSIKKMQKMKRLQRVAKGIEGPNVKSSKDINRDRKGKTGKETTVRDYDKAKELKSSQAFFAKLQNQVHNQVKSVSSAKVEKKKKKPTAVKL